jgi:hypothetical protein
VPRERPQLRGEELEMVRPLGQDERRSAGVDRSDHIVQDHLVAYVVGREPRIQRLDLLRRLAVTCPKGGLAADQAMRHKSLRTVARVHDVTDGPALHVDDRLVAVTAVRRRRQPGHVPGLHCGEHTLERERREMMALVDDHVTVGGDDVVHVTVTHQTLHRRDAENARRPALSPADATDGLRIDSEEQRELGHPLLQQRRAVHQDDGVPSARCDQVSADHRLPRTGRRDQHAHVVSEQTPRRFLLHGRQTARERHLDGLAPYGTRGWTACSEGLAPYGTMRGGGRRSDKVGHLSRNRAFVRPISITGLLD